MRSGGKSSAAAFNTYDRISSGPVAVYGVSPLKSLCTPFWLVDILSNDLGSRSLLK